MSKSATLLVEILTEELPPKALRRLGEEFALKTLDGLVPAGLAKQGVDFIWFATPRRLAVLVPNTAEVAADRQREIQGPPTTAGPDAMNGFARKFGVSPEKLERKLGPKGEFYVARVVERGARLNEVLALIVENALKALPIPKLMRWGNGDAQFARPVHGIVMLHGKRVVPGIVLGVTASRTTRGHRFMGKREISLANADQYETRLRKNGMVIADFQIRRSEIKHQLKAKAKELKAGLGSYHALLDEVTALVEHSTVYVGKFDSVFLEVPQECLVLTMRKNQKYFPLFDSIGKLLPRFLIVSNMRVADPRHIIGGNERVVRPRFEDAQFFYNQDRRKTLWSRVEQLKSVIYYADRLGTQFDRTMRVKTLSGELAKVLGANVEVVTKAAALSKADLLTGMVTEFPELQGTMGRYYALNDNESGDVANAIEQHYWPRFAGDRIPEVLNSCVLALADKVESIVGMFGVGQQPTSDRDPLALRRTGLGIVRILIEKKLDISLTSLVDLASKEMPHGVNSDWLTVVEFLLERVKTYFLEQGYSAKAIASVLDPFGSASYLHTLLSSVKAASDILATEEGKILAEMNKRITNILKKSGFPVPFGLRPDHLAKMPDPNLFTEKAEIQFWNSLLEVGARSLKLREKHQYAESLLALSELAFPTKSFFEQVQVNVKEPAIQSNRITLLQHARAYMNQVADLSLMAS